MGIVACMTYHNHNAELQRRTATPNLPADLRNGLDRLGALGW